VQRRRVRSGPEEPPATGSARRELAVFLSNGRGLGDWQKLGSLSRELALYRHLSGSGWGVTFYSYDRTREVPTPDFPARTVPQWPWLLPRQLNALYGAALPVLRRPAASDRPAIVLTNQAHSGWPAIGAAKLWGAKLVARCGYVYGEREEAAGHSGLRVRRRSFEEKTVFRLADRCVVPTEFLAEWLISRYAIDAAKVEVIPNFVDTNTFRPLDVQPDVDVISVGRLVEKKRHHLLLDALEGTGVRVRIIGRGSWRERLIRIADERKVALDLIPSVANERLPELMNRARLFVNLSRWEGHPKALIEAMSCGLACVGADAPGISNLITHGRTGWLVQPETGAVRSAITTLLADDGKRAELGAAARAHAVATFSLDEVAGRFAEIFDTLSTNP
jgi:glycosyltransferase involved in cell wall biosynthesis